jgi:hypothetical protein
VASALVASLAVPRIAGAQTQPLPMLPVVEPAPLLDAAVEPDVTLRWRAYASARTDVVVNDSRMQDAELPMWVLPEPAVAPLAGLRDDTQPSNHPWLTRVGVAVERWRISDDVVADGRFELDFL